MKKIKKTRSLQQQFKYAISQSVRFGESKYNAEKNIKETSLFSIRRTEDLRDFTRSFSKYMNENYGDVKFIKEIKSEHYQSFLNSKKDTCTARTLNEYRSRFRQMETLTNNVYNMRKKETRELEIPQSKKEPTRTLNMAKEDITKVLNSFREREAQNSNAYKSVILAYNFGLRSKEISHLKAEHINFEKKEINLCEGTKGGKHRTLKFTERQEKYLKSLVNDIGGVGRLIPIQEQSINKGLQKELEKVGLSEKYENTSIHAIRKTYARERYDTLRSEKTPIGEIDKKAWGIVQQELGHTTTFRLALYETYIGY